MKILTALTPARLRVLLIALPLALGALYYSLFAADRYVSISEVTLRQASGDMGALGGAALLLAGVATPAHEDTLNLREYMLSLTLLKRLDQRLKLRAHFGAPMWDPFFRLWGWATQEDFLDYYRARVAVTVDDQSSAVTVRAEGFTPTFAHQLNSAILQESERYVNEVSHGIARDNLTFAESELTRAGQRLQKAKADVLTFQNKYQLLDPMLQAQASGALTSDLQAQITKTETDLRNLRSYLQEDAPQVSALRIQLKALQAQVGVEGKRATGGGKGDARLNTLAIEFQGLQLQAEIAMDAYKLTLATVESARIDSTRKLKSLVVIEAPSTPEDAEYPRRIYNLVTMFVASLLLFAVVRLVLATIQEHQD
jgi:capsular polysaccharide transport system permease protein